MSLEYRHYLDYNATSPISSNVLESLRSEEWFFSNPSSVHYSGKKTQREINLVSDYLYETFSLPESAFDIFYHSGATEGINTIIKGFALEAKNKGEKFIFVCLEKCIKGLISLAFLRLFEDKTMFLEFSDSKNVFELFDTSRGICAGFCCSGRFNGSFCSAILFHVIWPMHQDVRKIGKWSKSNEVVWDAKMIAMRPEKMF